MTHRHFFKSSESIRLQSSRIAVVVALCAFTVGCSTMDAQDCERADWTSLGRSDALDGRGNDTGAERASECQKFGIPANMRAYQIGFRAGLVDFCTPAGGAAFGERGRYYTRGYCPVGMEADFLAGYTPAYERYQFQEKVRQLRFEIDEREREIHKLRSQQGQNNAARIDGLESEKHRLQQQLNDEMMMRAVDR